ncbi:MAG TPA: ATP-binding protein [Terriglobales bacterium]|nr:ATP-binding protein [Terriglobales bacterium]
MRLALKSTLALLITYAAILVAVGVWTYNELRHLSTELAGETARLIADEVARTVTGSALDDLLQGDEASRLRLERIVSEIAARSAILTSLAVVDRNGIVVAADKVAVGTRVALPDVIFSPPSNPETISVGSPIGGEVYLAVPLEQGSQLVGYVRLSMRSQRISDLASQALRDLLVIALVGFLTVGAVGVTLHLQLVRHSQALANALELAVRGELVSDGPVDDEFSRALAVARAVGKELTEARGDRQQAHQQMAALMKAMDIGVLMIEPDAKLIFANARAAELLGFPEPTTLAQHWDAQLQADVGGLLRSFGDAFGRIFELPNREGMPRLKLEFYALGDGAPEGYLVLVRSAESIEALESELGLAMQMRGLTRFYTAFAHDLRAPLNAMVMTLELLKVTLMGRNESPEVAQEKCNRYVGVLNDEIQRLNRQVRTLLTHTAPPTGERRELDLRLLMQDLHDLLAPQAKRQRVTISTAMPEQPVHLQGYVDRLKQAMLNVLINALEAMPNGGELHIEIKPSGDHCELVVRDSGGGIPPEVLRSIFEMQFTTKSGGTGVGLYVARSVVEAHGGTIAVDSQPGNGTTFSIRMPVQQPV